MNKRMVFVMLLIGCAALSVYGQNRTIPLDNAIRDAAINIEVRIAAQSKIALISFNSPSVQFSDYVFDELTANLVYSRQLIVVDRKEIDLIRRELDFQYSGDVDDNSMQELGRMLGAEFIVSGSLTDIGGVYRIMIRVLNVQTTAVELQYRTNIVNDSKVKALIEGTSKLSKKPVTTADKIGTGALNIIFGLGSYLEGDSAGGITLSAGYALAAGLIVLEFTALDWDSPMVGVPITAGVTIAGLTLVYGFVRPFIYHRSPQAANILDNTQPGIVMTSDRSGNNAPALRLSYSIKF